MGSFWRDIRYGGRMLAKAPGHTAAAVVALSLGIGLTTATFSIVYGVVWRGLPYPRSERLMGVSTQNLARDLLGQGVDVHDYLDWCRRQRSFEGLAGYTSSTVTVSGGDRPERLDGGALTANALDLLRVKPLLGRGFRPGEDRPGAAPVVLLSYQLWQNRFNGDRHVVGKAVRVNATTKEELEKEKGKLAGKIVFLGELREVKPHAKAELERYDEKSLAELFQYEIPGGPPRYDREDARRRYEFRKAADKFFAEEKPLAIVTPGRHDGGTMIVQSGGSYKKGDPQGIPSLVMAVEHFGRISRLLERNVEVDLELDVKARFLEDDLMQANTVAEIPGTDRRGEVVMLGAHLDSWHAGTGATDDGAGVVMTMEAVRILQALGVKPKRTIRIALWSGEEQGLFGSKAYVSEHFASRPEKPEDKDLPWFMQKDTWPITVKPEHAKLSAYFNVDNGTGKVRGIYAQENAAVVPIFEAWMGALKDLGATTVTMRNTSSTDHVSFDRVGLPGFQFIQDELEYDTRTHHSNMDVYERLQKEDLMQASVVLATFVYEAATREGLLPRKPMPKEEPSEKKPEIPKKNVAPPERSTEKPPVPAGSARRG